MSQGTLTQRATMTIQECARYIGISAKKLSNMHRDGQGPPRVQLGGRVLYRPAAVDEWMKQQEGQGA